MAIHVDVIVNLHERQLQQASRKLKREADKLGLELSDRISTPLKNVAPKAIKALDAESDAIVRLRRQSQETNKVLKDTTSSAEQRTRALEDLSKATRAATRSTDEFKTTNERELKATRERAYYLGENTKALKDLNAETDAARKSIRELHETNKGFIARSPALAKSFQQIGDAADKVTEATGRYNRMVKDGTATREQVIRQGKIVRDAHLAEQRLIRDTTSAYQEATAERERSARQRGSVTGPNLGEFRQLRADIDQTRQSFAALGDSNQRFIEKNPALAKSFEQVGDATSKTARETDRYNRMVLSGSATREQLLRQTQAVRAAYETERRAIRDTTQALKEKQDADRDRTFLNRKRDAEAGSVSNAIKEMGTNAFLLSRGLGTVAAPPAMIFLIDLAKVAVTAAQSIALLPAAAVAAGAGIGTLQLATQGFSDTLSNMGDPEKFAEAINKLAPNAQQAALEIKALVDGPLHDLQQATQDAFFAGTPELLHNLANTFTPMIQDMTTGIASSMNQMMTDVGNQLMTPESQTQIQNILANIKAAFNELIPMGSSLSQAFLDLTSVGSDFLPGLARDLAEVAREFANFIREARDNGSLREFMQNGIDAVKALGDGLMTLGGILYQAFGADGKQNIADFKDAMEGLNEIVGVLTLNFDFMAGDMREEFSKLTGPARAYVDLIMDIPEALATVGQAFTTMANLGIAAFNKIISGFNQMTGGIMKHPLAKLLSPAGALLGNMPQVPMITNTSTGAGDSGMWSGVDAMVPPTVPSNRFDNNGYSGNPTGAPPPGAGRDFWTNPTTGQRMTLVPGLGWVAADDPRAQGANLGPYAPGTVPAPPPPGGAPSESDTLNNIKSGLDPSQYTVDPFAGMNVPPGLGVSSGGGSPFIAAPGMNARDFADSVMKPYWESQGLTVGDHGADSHGEHQNGALDIMVPDLNTGSSVLQQLLSDPNVYGAIFNNQTYGYGHGPTPQDYSAGHTGDPTQDHQNHVHAWYGNGARAGATITGDNQTGYSPLAYNNNNPYDPAGMGYYQTDQSAVLDARNDVVDKAHDFEEKKKDLLAAEQSGLKSQEELGDLRWSVDEAERNWRDSQVKLGEAMTGKFKELNDSANSTLKDVGAELDADFGISQGLSGIAKNLTMFLGNLAFAPMLGQLSAVQQADEQRTGIKGGFGLMGMMGAQNIAQGQSPVFGRPLTPGANNGGLASVFGGGGQPGMPPGGQPGMPPGAGQPGLNWDALASKESGGNWGINTGNGYYGGLQFDEATWAQYGGPATGYPRADLAPKEVQIAIAQQAMTARGGGQSLWPQNFQQLSMPQAPAPGYASGGAVGQGLGSQRGDGRTQFDPRMLIDNSLMRGTTNPADRMLFGGGDGPLVGRWRPGDYTDWQGWFEDVTDRPHGLSGGPKLGPTDSVYAGLTPGEHVLTTDDVAAMGGQAGVYSFRQSLHGFVDGGGVDQYGNPTNPGPAPGPTATTEYGGQYGAGKGTGSGGVGITPGGSIDTAINLAASAFPGVGQAAATGIKLANRAIQYGGQVAGIGVQGLMETFLPTGGSELANNGWLTRLVGGLAGAAPAIPNTAGKMTEQSQQAAGVPQPGMLLPNETPTLPTANQLVPPMPPGDQHLDAGSTAPGPTTINVQYDAHGQTEDRNGADLSYHLDQAYNPAPVTGSR